MSKSVNTVGRAVSDAAQMFDRAGVSFALYGADESTDRLISMDLLSQISPTGMVEGVETGTLLAMPVNRSGQWGSFAYFAA